MNAKDKAGRRINFFLMNVFLHGLGVSACICDFAFIKLADSFKFLYGQPYVLVYVFQKAVEAKYRSKNGLINIKRVDSILSQPLG
jgi:hypothetical protein